MTFTFSRASLFKSRMALACDPRHVKAVSLIDALLVGAFNVTATERTGGPHMYIALRHCV